MPLKRLNENQLEAAIAPAGHNLIIASAGTGKTSTIVGRIAHLLQNGVAPEEILLLTFTNKAAAEMVARVAAFFGKEIASKIVAGTFHSVSYKWLKNLDEPPALKQPSELKLLFKSVYEQLLYKAPAGENRPMTHQSVLDYYWLWQNTESDDFGEWLLTKNDEHKPFLMLYLDMLDKFDEMKKELGFAGFNDLLLRMRDRLLSDVPNPFKEVLVDEYQDTNPLQNSLLEALNPPSLFCVGDYDQSIYAFNGAQIGIIASFTDRYQSASVFSLQKNYRSTRPILALANKVIENNERIYPKKLEVVRQDVFSFPTLLAYDELFIQYEDIAKRIQKSPFTQDEIAVIFRNNSSADGIEASLREFGIPCRRKGSRSFFEAQEVRAMLDLVTLFINPKDLLAFIHVFEYAPGIGTATAKEVYDGLMRLGHGSLFLGLLTPDEKVEPFPREETFLQGTLFADLTPAAVRQEGFAKTGLPGAFLRHPILTHPKLTPTAVVFLHELKKLWDRKRELTTPLQLINAINASPLFTAIADHLSHQRSTKNGQTDEKVKAEAKERIQGKATTLKELSRHYKETDRFLNAMVLGGNEMSEGAGVNLLSVHASKGLEFEEVYVIDLMDGRFPNRKLMAQGGAIEEERRLFYVAVTRAKQSLFLSFAKYDKFKKTDHLPSQFLYEAGMLEDPKAKATSA